MASQNFNYRSKDFEYRIDSTRIIIDKYIGSATSVNIPDHIDDLPVTTIGNCAFYDCKSLTSIQIPNSVTIIGDNAFEYCKSLRNISISNSVTTIGDGAFDGCSSLTSIQIPNSVTTIGERAFFIVSRLSQSTF